MNEGAAEQAQRRSQPTHGDPHLVHSLDLVARAERRKVAEEMGEAVAQDGGDRLVERRVSTKDGIVGPDRLGRFECQQRMSAFGLALKPESDGERFDQREAEVEQLNLIARLELEFELRDRRALFSSNGSLGRSDLDHSAVRTDGSGGAADVGAELRRQRLCSGQDLDLPGDRFVEQGEIGLPGRRHDFCFLAIRGARIVRRRPLQAHDPVAFHAAYTQGDARMRKVAGLEIEIDRFELFPPGRSALRPGAERRGRL